MDITIQSRHHFASMLVTTTPDYQVQVQVAGLTLTISCNEARDLAEKLEAARESAITAYEIANGELVILG
jgi:hypothetical protein